MAGWLVGGGSVQWRSPFRCNVVPRASVSHDGALETGCSQWALLERERATERARERQRERERERERGRGAGLFQWHGFSGEREGGGETVSARGISVFPRDVSGYCFWHIFFRQNPPHCFLVVVLVAMLSFLWFRGPLTGAHTHSFEGRERTEVAR